MSDDGRYSFGDRRYDNEGQILYGLLGFNDLPASDYIMLAIVAQFFGLATCGFFTTSANRAKMVPLLGGLTP